MKETKYNGHRAREVLIGMIVSTPVLCRLAEPWAKDKQGAFASRAENLIARWAVEYHKKHGAAPGAAIESKFSAWAGAAQDQESVKVIERFLSELSGQWKRKAKGINPDHIVDEAGILFKEVQIRRLRDSLESDLTEGTAHQKSYERINKFSAIEVGVGAGIDLFHTPIPKDAFSVTRESLIKYDGDLGRFFGDELERDAFIAFLAPEKRGKSWWLLDVAYRAFAQRRNVAFFEAGDLTKRQVELRFRVRMGKRPKKPTDKDKPVLYPCKFSTTPGGEKKYEIDHTPLHFKEGVTAANAERSRQAFMEKHLKGRSSNFKMSCHFNSTLSVAMVSSILDGWKREFNWQADVVVIDYADILAPPAGFQGESRDAINENWKHLRRLSQEKHCLVLTATQAKGTSYTADSLDMTHYADDKRKFAHVTGMVAINQTPDEKKDQVQRLGWVILREDENTFREVHVAGCLALSNPAVLSSF